MDVTLREMRWAIVVAQHRSLRQAAAALSIQQSTLSRRLQDIEYQMGTVLFERTNGGTRPTIAGQEFLDVARRIVQEAENLAIRLKTRLRGDSGHLTVGVHSSLSVGNLRSTLVEHRRRVPEVSIGLVDGSCDRLMGDLMNSTLDVAFVVDPDLRWHGKFLPVWTERVVVALPESHALASRDVVHWRELKSETVLLPLRGASAEFSKLLSVKIGSLGDCNIRRQDVSLDRLLTLVGIDLGILLVLEGATGVSYPGVVFRQVHDDDGPIRLAFHAIWRQENSSPPLHRFLDLLRERYPDF